MQRARALTAMMLAMTIGVSANVYAQGDRGRGHDDQHGVTPAEQQRRVQEEQQREAQYRRTYPQQIQSLHAQQQALQAQHRTAAVREQQDYEARLRAEQAQINVQRHYDQAYITTPHTFRYVISGTPHETNQFGANLLRQAVNDGYAEGYRAGQADHADHWRGDFANSPIYREATFGYTGNYVDQTDYSYYFRQGFQRGYDDGYNSRYRYGAFTNGSYSVLGNVLNGILGLVTIH